MRLQRSAGNGATTRWLSASPTLAREPETNTLNGKVQVGESTLADGEFSMSFADTGKILTGPSEFAVGSVTISGTVMAGGVPIVAVQGGTLTGAGAGAAGEAGAAAEAAKTLTDVASRYGPAVRMAWEAQKRLIAARAAAQAEQIAARAVVGTVVRAGIVLFIVVGPPLAAYQIITHDGEWESPWAAYAKEVDKRLRVLRRDAPPGGAPPPAEAPGAPAPAPADDPNKPGAADAPGTGGEAAQAPGAGGGAPARTPAVVDDPDDCFRLNSMNVDHHHHIFPKQYRDELSRIWIEVDEWTVTLPAKKHIGHTGLHKVLDWNAYWEDFFMQIPTGPLTEKQSVEWHHKAKNLAFDLMIQAGIDQKQLHVYRSSKPSGPPKK